MNSDFFKYLIIPIILFIASLAIIFWILMPLWGDVKSALYLQEQNQENLNNRLKLTANLENSVSQYNSHLSDISSFDKAIPQGNNIPEILINLEALASGSGMTFSGVDFKSKDFKNQGVKTLVMEIRVKGSYLAFKNYLEAMEKSLRIFDVSKISFVGVAPGQQTGAKTDNLEFNLVVNTYYY